MSIRRWPAPISVQPVGILGPSRGPVGGLIMKVSALLLSAATSIVLTTVPSMAQQVTIGAAGSLNATTTIDGGQLPSSNPVHPVIKAIGVGTQFLTPVSDNVPKLNVEATCKASVEADKAMGLALPQTFDKCMSDE